MAFSTTKATSFWRRGAIQCVWTVADTSGNSAAESFPGAESITIQCTGTFGAGGSVTIHASNDGTNFVILPTAVTFTAAGIKSIALADLAFKFYRAALTAGDATTNLTLTAVATGLRR